MAIYARLENGTYMEVTGVYKTDGTEITEIFQGDRLVYTATNEIYGTVPLYYDGLGYELIDYVIYGNAIQDGTPSADAPVDAVGCGVRTGNLAPDAGWVNGYITTNGRVGPVDAVKLEKSSDYIPLWPGATITYSYHGGDFPDGSDVAWIAIGFYRSDKSFISRLANAAPTPLTVNAPVDTAYIRLSFRTYGREVSDVMLNLGSEALPYEPYGIKLPLTVNGTEYPIYLGQVETTRRIKKINATISYMIHLANGNEGAVTEGFTSVAAANSLSKCNIALYGGASTIGTFYINPRNAVFVCAPGTTISEARNLLSGAVIWYLMAEPETAIVNEPLMKIGDYADTVSFAQAGVTIPTVNGANALDMASPVKPSEVYIKGKGIKPTGYGQLVDVNGVNILDKDGRPINVHGQ